MAHSGFNCIKCKDPVTGSNLIKAKLGILIVCLRTQAISIQAQGVGGVF